MARHLTRMAIDKVSLVDRGANGRRFAVLKRAEDEEPQQESITDRVLGALGLRYDSESGTVRKADTFGDIRGREAATEAAEDGFRIMQEAFWSAQYGRDESGEPLSTDARVALVETSLSQFGQYLTDAMRVQKVGRKISGARLDRMKEAMRILGGIIEGVEQGWWTPPDGEAVTKGAPEDDMNEQQVAEAIQKAIEAERATLLAEDGPLMTGITKAVAGVLAKAEPTESAPDTSDLEAKVDELSATQGQVIEAVAKVLERIEAVEKSRRQSLPGTDGDEPVAKRGNVAKLSGILG